jgi:hypothetical protein
LFEKIGRGEFMCIQRISRFFILAGSCSAAILLIGVATSASSTSSAHQGVVPSVSIERTGKADRLKLIKEPADASNAIGVELTGPSDVVIRDRDGNILFAVDHSARTTIVGKQRRQRATFPDTPETMERALPDGCEGAFSPYVDPARSHIIGRCVSGVSLGNMAFA